MCKLKYVALHITEKCSHNCSFCYYKKKQNFTPLKSKPNERFSLQTLKKIIDELYINNVKEIFLLGGDPAEYVNFLDLAEYAWKKELLLTSVSNTHEYNCDPSILSKYLSICETTIHGESEEFHDNVCESIGAYEKVLNNLKMFRQLGCSTGITINIMPSNVKNIYSIVSNIINKHGKIIDYINVQRIVPHGKATKEDNHYLQKDNLVEALTQIDKIFVDYNIEIECEDAFPLCLVPKKFWKYIHRCEWGYEKLSINGDGGVSRCGADPRYNLGNVLETSLKEIWEESPYLNDFRKKDFLPQKCKECDNITLCGGGCSLGAWSGKELDKDILLSN